MMQVKIMLILGALVILSACSMEDIKRAGYDALHQRQCIEQVGVSDCDPNHPDYDEYQRQRSEVVR